MRGSLAFCAIVAVATPAVATETVSYSYDTFGRLVTVSHAGSTNNGLQQSYTFDAADNRTNLTVTGSPNGSAEATPIPVGRMFGVSIGYAY